MTSAASAFAGTENFCEARRDSLRPLFEKHYRTYDRAHYMSLWCVRNSENLYRSLSENGLVGSEDAYVVYMIHRNEDSSLFPRHARYGARSWSNHAFLVIDGFALDQDFDAPAPLILSLTEYMSRMWGERAQDAVFQIRKARRIDDYTNYGIRESIRNGDHVVTDREGLFRFFGAEKCLGPVVFR